VYPWHPTTPLLPLVAGSSYPRAASGHYIKAKVKVRRCGTLAVFHGPRLLQRCGAEGFHQQASRSSPDPLEATISYPWICGQPVRFCRQAPQGNGNGHFVCNKTRKLENRQINERRCGPVDAPGGPTHIRVGALK
jgi:hypothetical protein